MCRILFRFLIIQLHIQLIIQLIIFKMSEADDSNENDGVLEMDK